ncbi:MAG: hypothetical protein NTY01_08420 [Verrucomicrobia bacterium]|nr:hypothetical protein [Verrucomicrobiota bacterium]
MKDLLKGFVAGVGTCLTLIIGIAASPTDSTVRGYLRGLVDSTASPPPLCQATNLVCNTLTAMTNNALSVISTTNVVASGRIDTMALTATNNIVSAVGTIATISNTTLNVTGIATLNSVVGASTVASATGTFSVLGGTAITGGTSVTAPTVSSPTGTFTTLTAGPVRTTNTFLATNTSLQIVTDAKGLVVGVTVTP